MAATGKSKASVIPVILAHLVAAVLVALVLVWLLHFREGLAFRSHIKPQIFNVCMSHRFNLCYFIMVQRPAHFSSSS